MISFLRPEEQHQHTNGGGWVANTATVEATSYVGVDARVYGNARVYGDAQVYGNTRVYGDARVYGNARVSGNTRVFGNARVFGYTQVYGNAQVYGDARVSGDAQVYGYARVSGNAWETSPLYIHGTKHSITNCACGYIAIGCQVHTFAEWKAKYKAIGKSAKYTPAQIKEYGLLIALVIKLGKKVTK